MTMLFDRGRAERNAAAAQKKKVRNNPVGDVAIPYSHQLELLPWQRTLDDMFNKNPLLGGEGPDTFVLACHRRAGKDILSFMWCVQMCMSIPNFNVLYLGLTQTEIVEAVLMGTWEPSSPDDPGEFLGLIPKGVIADMDEMRSQRWHSKAVNLNRATITFPNGSRIRFKGADNLRARGREVRMVVFSEYAFYQNKERVDSIVLSMLAERDYGKGAGRKRGRGLVIYASTGDGRNKYAKLALGDDDNERRDSTYSIVMPNHDPRAVTMDGTRQIVTDEELNEMVASGKMSLDVVRREYKVDFSSAVYGSVFAHEIDHMKKHNKFPHSIDYNPHRRMTTGWDLGFSNPTVVLVGQQDNGLHHIIKEFEFKRQSFITIAEEINAWLLAQGTPDAPAKWMAHWLPWDAGKEIYPSGKEVFTAERMLRDAGLDNTFITSQPSRKEDAIELLRLYLPTNIRVSRTGCPKLYEALSEYRYRQSSEGRWDTKPDQRHWSANYVDALQSYVLGCESMFGRPNFTGGLLSPEERIAAGEGFVLDGVPSVKQAEALRQMKRDANINNLRQHGVSRSRRLSWMSR